MGARTALAGAAVTALFCLLLAGCSTAAPEANEPDAPTTEVSEIDQLAECVREAGFDVTVFPPDGMSVDAPPEQQSEVAAVQEACRQSLGVFQFEELTDADYDTLYELTLENAKCLTELGYDIPPAPSRQVFQDTYDSDPWLPYSSPELAELGPKEFAKAEEKCPQSRVE
ncbi:hypothetical protein ASE14_02375 [Agromyces sp. Root81]|uniref:hypothetical protein n=1 Tax=Agromyces sp. Root81 TaxID=1736601 RepID=UPI0006FCDDD3|nr:hypothetical protein [Agromyces sp. Root81]KRC62690.1 hypothetical protein ASE14_02375 [Agromyces sp. Root81]